MNIALASIIIVILLLPAYSFRFTLYYSGSYSKAAAKKSITEQFFLLALPSLVYHQVCLSVLHFAVADDGQVFSFETLIRLILGSTTLEQDRLLTQPEGYWISFSRFMCYNATVNGLAMLFGWVVRTFINFLNWRRMVNDRPRFYNLYNEWYYLFAYDTRNINRNWWVKCFGPRVQNDTDYVFVDVMVGGKGKNLVYSGFLWGFKTDGDRLDKLFLQDAQRWHMEEENRLFEPLRMTDIPGDLFVIEGQEIKNLNIYYFSLDPKQSDDAAATDEKAGQPAGSS